MLIRYTFEYSIHWNQFATMLLKIFQYILDFE